MPLQNAFKEVPFLVLVNTSPSVSIAALPIMPKSRNLSKLARVAKNGVQDTVLPSMIVSIGCTIITPVD